MTHATDTSPQSLAVAVMTVSDTRTDEDDTSGRYLVEALESAGHSLAAKAIVVDDIYQIRAVLSAWIADGNVDVALVTGGTGFSSRDSTPEAVLPLVDKEIDGYGEVFRALSYQEIGSSTVQSRAVAGFANNTVIFCMPGSTGACRTAWERILHEQLDARHLPGNLVGHTSAAPTSLGGPSATPSRWCHTAIFAPSRAASRWRRSDCCRFRRSRSSPRRSVHRRGPCCEDRPNHNLVLRRVATNFRRGPQPPRQCRSALAC